jgi:putative ABC transport system permease protein
VAGFFYTLLLRLLPRSARDRHADEMRRLFARRLAESRGAGAAARLIAREYTDVVRAALRERRGADPLHHQALPPPPRRRLRWLAGLGLDLRFATRLLRSQPAFTLTAIATLALGIGANAAVFSVVYGVLLRPLALAEPDRVVALFHGSTVASRGTHSPVTLRDVAARNRSLSTLALYDQAVEVVTGHGEPARVSGYLVTPDFFAVVPAVPVAGRRLNDTDVANGRDVVVLSAALARQRFGDPAAAVGERLTIGGVPHEVVGVLPVEGAFPDDARFWAPLVFDADDLDPSQRGAHYVEALGRLRPGVSVADAQADMDRVIRDLAVEYPNYHEGTRVAVVPLRTALTEDVSGVLWLLFGGVGLVLLVACANVANLLLSRSALRQSEVALRASLGASRVRLLRQFLVESVLLAAAGAAAGLLLAGWVIQPLVALAPEQLPRAQNVALNWPVVIFTIVVSTLCAIAFGLAPARGGRRANLAAGVMAAGSRGTAGPGRRRLRHALAITEVAFALILVAGALLLVRSITNLSRIEPGFDPDGAVTFSLSLPEAEYDTEARVMQGLDEIMESFRRVPGVVAVGLAQGAPFSRSNPLTSFEIAGDTVQRDEEPTTDLRIIWGDYFQSLRIPVLAGRTFGPEDTSESQLVAVVNETFAEQFFPGENPIGRSIRTHASLSRAAVRGHRTIIGVVDDVRQRSLTSPVSAEVFHPYTQHALSGGLVIVRTEGQPAGLAANLRARLHAVDPGLPMAQIRTMDDLIGGTTAQHRFTGTLLAVFAGVALTLAAIGLYGTLSFGVAQRTREIGVRMALGAERWSVLTLFVGEGARVAAAGGVLGLLGAVLLARQLDALLVGVSRYDPMTLAAAAIGVACVAIAASLIPALRATRLDPTVALRDQ